MARVKCALCERNLRDGEWEWLEVDGEQVKVCMNKYRCDTRRRVRKEKAARQIVEDVPTVEETRDNRRSYIELALAVMVFLAAAVMFCIAGGRS